AWITPIIWVTYFCSSFAIYLKASFGLLFLEKLGLSVPFANNLIFVGGTIGAVGAIFVMAFVERRGPIWIAVAPLVGIPLALLIGSGAILGGSFFIPVVILGSIMIGVGHASVISITTIYYPSAVRSTGGGWASFMAKFAAVAAPNVGAAYFLADKESVLRGYTFTALCLAGVVAGILALSFFARRLSKPHIELEPEPALA
ncbi:MAG: putative aromatic acid transporter, partial [Proteobacteria bacterium]|nr:putative aromatic acid transporter [Pseudomonadota bacterium]